VHGGGLDDDSVGAFWNDFLIQTRTKVFLGSYTAEDLGGRDIFLNGKKVTGNLVFQVVEPVPVVYYGVWFGSEMNRTITNE
jgi:hypothetical protein